MHVSGAANLLEMSLAEPKERVVRTLTITADSNVNKYTKGTYHFLEGTNSVPRMKFSLLVGGNVGKDE